MSQLPASFLALPKAELHVHLEGSLEPATVVELAARHGVTVSEAEVAARYQYADFRGFLDAFKWVTSFLRTPQDYALAAERLFAQLRAQNVVYAEVTLSVGVMLWRKLEASAIFDAVDEAARRALPHGLRVAWVVDCVRQFGPGAAMDVARHAAQWTKRGVVALGMGGDELALPAADFRAVYDFARAAGLHSLVHAGEIGGPQAVRDAVEILGAERIGHGIAAVADDAVMAVLIERGVALEVCPTSNLRTGALAGLLAKQDARIEEHPARHLHERGVTITLSTDDPPMFGCTLAGEYAAALRMGFSLQDLVRVARNSFACAFLPQQERENMLGAFDTGSEDGSR